jgi:hypothetical protein
MNKNTITRDMTSDYEREALRDRTRLAEADFDMNKTNSIDRFAAFKAELRENIEKKIKELREDGVVSMSERNLLSVTHSPRTACGPIGTNAQWVYAQMFHEAVMNLPRAYCSFVY